MSKPVKTSQKVKVPSLAKAATNADFLFETPVEVAPIEASRIEGAVASRYDYHDIHSAPRNGALIAVSATGADEGVDVFWKRTRAFANATHRWEETGFFVNIITNLRVDFEPRYWRTRGMYEV